MFHLLLFLHTRALADFRSQDPTLKLLVYEALATRV